MKLSRELSVEELDNQSRKAHQTLSNRVSWVTIVKMLATCTFLCVRGGLDVERISLFRLQFCGRACRDLPTTRSGKVCMY